MSNFNSVPCVCTGDFAETGFIESFSQGYFPGGRITKVISCNDGNGSFTIADFHDLFDAATVFLTKTVSFIRAKNDGKLFKAFGDGHTKDVLIGITDSAFSVLGRIVFPATVMNEMNGAFSTVFVCKVIHSGFPFFCLLFFLLIYHYDMDYQFVMERFFKKAILRRQQVLLQIA